MYGTSTPFVINGCVRGMDKSAVDGGGWGDDVRRIQGRR